MISEATTRTLSHPFRLAAPGRHGDQPTAVPRDAAKVSLPTPEDAARTGSFGLLLGKSAPMLTLYDLIRRVAPTGATVLLTGETGTGKEVVARTIHDHSHRRERPFVAMNCGAVSAALIESELFGHERGSFTGANRRHQGVFAQADGGTLFLDEITEMPVDLQVKLLRVLETGLFHRVGGEEPVQTDVRVVAAANRVPEQAVREGRLREDLFYRLRVFPITLQPLRGRRDDIPLLAQHFLDRLTAETKSAKRFATTAFDRMVAHDWPGNVRELENFVQQAFLLADGDLDAECLAPTEHRTLGDDRIEVLVGSSIAAAEQQLIMATMDRMDGRKLEVAKVLGISLKTLYCRLNLYATVRLAVG
jgi:two-component system response regulator AtoC